MSKQMYSNRFSVIIQADGECGIRFMTEWPIIDPVLDKIAFTGPSKMEIRPQERDAKEPVSKIVDDQHVFMSIESLKSLQSEITSAIEQFEHRQ